MEFPDQNKENPKVKQGSEPSVFHRSKSNALTRSGQLPGTGQELNTLLALADAAGALEMLCQEILGHHLQGDTDRDSPGKLQEERVSGLVCIPWAQLEHSCLGPSPADKHNRESPHHKHRTLGLEEPSEPTSDPKPTRSGAWQSKGILTTGLHG